MSARTHTFGLSANVSAFHGSPTLMVAGRPVPPMWYTSYAYDNEEYLRELGASGIRVFFIPHKLTWGFEDRYEKLRQEAEMLLRAVPEALIILRSGLYPPREWMDAHPEVVVQFSDGTPMTTWMGDDTKIQALSSRAWRERQIAEIDAFLQWLSGQPFATRVIGFFLGAGGTEEWYLPGQIDHGEEHGCVDHSPAFQEQFADSLREKYGSDEALQRAWKQEHITLEAPLIPDRANHAFTRFDLNLMIDYHDAGAVTSDMSADENGLHIGSFLNPDNNRMVADFGEAMNNGTADSIIYFARYLKTATANTKVVGAFYGSFAPPWIGTATGTTRILDSGAIDFLAAPGNYENRLPGGVVAQRTMQDAFRLRNRIFVVEEDTRTSLLASQGRWLPPKDDWGVYSIGDSVELLKREFGRNLSEDLHAWWFDMCGGDFHFYNHPVLLDLFRRQQDVMDAFYATPRRFTPEIGLIYDAESLLYVSDRTGQEIGHLTRNWEIHRIGAPVAYHYTDDLALEHMPAYKLCVFMGAFVLDEKKRDMIRAYLERTGAMAVWLYAPGLIHPEKTPSFSPDNIADLTGIRVAMDMQASLPHSQLTGIGKEALPDLRADWEYGWFDRQSFGRIVAIQPEGPAMTALLCPTIYGDDDEADVLMRFTDSQRPSMLMKTQNGSTHVLACFRAMHAQAYRALARRAGCHIYNESDDVLYASNRFITLHASESGEKRISLPNASNPFEIYEKAAYGKDTDVIHCTMRRGQTKTFHLDGEL